MIQLLAIDFFAGCGMAAYGLTLAGFSHVLAAEWNPFAMASFSANFPYVPLCDWNLYLYSAAEICAHYGVNPQFSGLVWLSPPCQGLSKAGANEGVLDWRNTLLFKAEQVADHLPNAWIVVENVADLLNVNNKPIYDQLTNALGRRRKCFSIELNAKDFGLPQSRPRIFIIAAPEGFDRLPERPIYDGKCHYLLTTIHAETGFVDEDTDHQKLADVEIVLNSELGAGENWSKSERGKKYAAHKYRGKKPPSNFLYRNAWSDLSPCVTASGSLVSFRCVGVHPDQLRYYTIGENKCFQGLPQRFLVAGSTEERIRQVGNGVPPVMAESIAREILKLYK